MDEKAEALLHAFAEAAHKAFLQPEDWRRLFVFVIYVYRNRLPVNGTIIGNRLFAYGFPEDVAIRLSADFDTFLELLSFNDQERSI